MELELRLSRLDELDTIMQMYNDARSFDGCAWTDDYPDRALLLDDFFANSLYAFASKNKIIGAVSLEFDENFGEFKCWKIQAERIVAFARLVISKDCLGQGYGTALVLELLSLLKKMSYQAVRILVSPINTSAIAVYKKTGFDFLCIETFPFGDFWLCERSLEE